jgi:hypothetical protein
VAVLLTCRSLAEYLAWFFAPWQELLVVTDPAEDATWRGQIDAPAALLVADGRPRSCPVPTGYFLDVLASRVGGAL